MVWFVNRLYTALVEEMAKEKTEKEIPTVTVTIERVDGIIYCYDLNQQFVCQGRNLTEIEQAYRDRYPNNKTCVLLLKGDKNLIKELSHES
jgi:hypothetical protein